MYINRLQVLISLRSWSDGEGSASSVWSWISGAARLSLQMTKAWLLLALVFLALERGTNGRDAEQASPPTHCLYSVQYVYSSVVHLVNNHPDNNGETSEYFCIYCTFVIKKTNKSRVFIWFSSTLWSHWSCFVLDVLVWNRWVFLCRPNLCYCAEGIVSLCHICMLL